ncbi:unnamed protein product [Acanthoscelides obtectus]|uniref:Uncharacterized protein n=1 Tax=Acanthoscelides obtectus TaxID=200917 RepID=A0A9P0NZ52_ACAOB|nr:unnamed protein product [Acanthoscelides obtectus]CAK1647178.1 hypothetical protein AOBTE_LOCUS15093 [Acanthoscelides obtectus]
MIARIIQRMFHVTDPSLEDEEFALVNIGINVPSVRPSANSIGFTSQVNTFLQKRTYRNMPLSELLNPKSSRPIAFFFQRNTAGSFSSWGTNSFILNEKQFLELGGAQTSTICIKEQSMYKEPHSDVSLSTIPAQFKRENNQPDTLIADVYNIFSEAKGHLINKVDETLEQTVSQRVPGPSASYANTLKKTVNVIVTPKNNDQSHSATRLRISQSVDPVDNNIRFSQVKNIKNGGILIKCDGSDDANKLPIMR